MRRSLVFCHRQNQNATGSSFIVDVDRDGMVLSMEGDAVLGKTACQLGGPGGERDFTGAKRSGLKCVPGPLGGLVAGQRLNVSLWPEGGSWPISPPPPRSGTVE